MTRTGKWRRRLDSIGFPAVLVAWVTCGVVLICQWKGMLPWSGPWIEAAIILVTVIPPLLLTIYAVAELAKIIAAK